MSEKVRVGQVNGAFGIEGAVKVASLTDFEDRFEPGSELYLDGVQRRVEWARRRPVGLIVKLTGIDNRTMAELERGRYLEVEEPHQLPSGAYYHHQLIGLDVVTESGRSLGRIEEVMQRPANDVWVTRHDGLEQLIPATRDAVRDVDVQARRVIVADWLTEAEDH
jgi:16S rRNA processing protein RimM